MFFDDISQIPNIATKTGFSIFSVPPSTELNLKNSYIITPTDRDEHGRKGAKTFIRVWQIRELGDFLGKKQSTAQYIVIKNAELMAEDAQNAFLKNLEEPRDNYHFIFLTEQPSALLNTILSRAQVYYLRPTSDPLTTPPQAEEKVKTLAKQLIAAKPADLPGIAETFQKIKKADERRNLALATVATAIEISYKSYFATGNRQFIKKIPNFITLYDNLNKNGHVKLHIVADLC